MKKIDKNSIDAIVTDPPYGLKFMGKDWDRGIPGKPFWQEMLRIAKPGCHLLSFGGTRTFHRLMCAIEDAGWELRDTLMWVYGSGFPKSHNIGKAIDKKLENKREETDYIAPDGRKRWGGNTFSIAQPPDGRGINKITKGNSPWEGWGTALKPAWEPIILARKPIEGTVAENVLKWGTGGLNIDACRIDCNLGKEDLSRGRKQNNRTTYFGKDNANIHTYTSLKGRFPANLIHDGSQMVLGLFPKTRSGRLSPARFFYCAKASKKERNAGLERLEERLYGQPGGARQALKNGKTEYKQKNHIGLNKIKKVKNNHPTVKPLKLIAYLIKLITPPKGIVLDPFIGSGTTGIACKELGFNFIGIELNPEYVKIAKGRISGSCLRS